MIKATATMAVATLVVGHVMAQGSLTPPGLPAPTMKTLEQVEPRIPISEAGFVIHAPGSYYLTTNLMTSGGAPGIQVASDNVVIDLNGFSLLGMAGSGNGIYVNSGVDNVQIQNGTIRDCLYHGIYVAGAVRCEFRNLRILGNARSGAAYDGLKCGDWAVVEGCRIEGNTGDGLDAGKCARITGNISADNGLAGLAAANNSEITGNTIVNNGGFGLRLTGSKSYVAENIVKGNLDNYDFAAGNQLNLLLCEVPETIDWPVSVRFAGSLTCSQTGVDGIAVNANDVTIDLDGHTLYGPGEYSENGIYQDPSYRNLTVLNGKVADWRSLNKSGVCALGRGGRISGIQVATNHWGIVTGDGCTIRDSTASYNTRDGFVADSGCTLSDCVASYNNIGIRAAGGSTIRSCAAYKNNTGISVFSGCTVSDCAAQQNNDVGIRVYYNNRVSDCVCEGNGDGSGNNAGIHVTGGNNRIDGNNVIDNVRGIEVDYHGNFIVRNTARGNGTNYVISVNNKVGAIVSAPNSSAINGSTGGAGVGSTDPWANFSF